MRGFLKNLREPKTRLTASTDHPMNHQVGIIRSRIKKTLRAILRPRKTVDVVIAYYGEKDDLNRYISFLNEFPNVTLHLYDKKQDAGVASILSNARFDTKVIPLPNIGGATHTYLYHLSSRYGSLADITLFFLGSGFRGRSKSRKTLWLLKHYWKCPGFSSENIFGSIQSDVDFELPVYESAYWGPIEQIRAAPFPLGAWIEAHTGHSLNDPHPESFLRSNKDTFAVTDEVAGQRPQEFWSALLDQFTTDKEGYNLEAIHFLERAWILAFFPPSSRSDLSSDDSAPIPPYCSFKLLHWDQKRNGPAT